MDGSSRVLPNSSRKSSWVQNFVCPAHGMDVFLKKGSFHTISESATSLITLAFILMDSAEDPTFFMRDVADSEMVWNEPF